MLICRANQIKMLYHTGGHIVSIACIHLCMRILCVLLHVNLCRLSVCVCALLCVSPWLQCECSVVTEDTGTQSPAGEGDEAQLGIIKPSTVSMKGPGNQAGLVSPTRSSLDWDWVHHNFPSLCSRIRGKRHKSDSDSAVEMCLDENPKTQLDFVVISLNEQYFVMPLIRAHPLSSVHCSDRQYQIIGRSTDNTEVNCNRPGQLYQL